MSLKTVLRFKYDNAGSEENIDFLEDEVYEVKIIKKRKIDLQRLQGGTPVITFLGDQQRLVVVDLFPKRVDVITNVETLKDVTDVIVFVCYYRNGTIAENISVKIDTNVPSYFYSGDKDTERIQLVFYEISVGPAVIVAPIIL